MFFTLCPISVFMPYLLGQIRGVGREWWLVACVNVCWYIHGAKESGVHVMNEIVRKRWIYGCECRHPFYSAVPGCPQGHRAPLGPILGGSLGIPPPPPPLLLQLQLQRWRRLLGRPCKVLSRPSSSILKACWALRWISRQWAQAANVHIITGRPRSASNRLLLLIRHLICPL